MQQFELEKLNIQERKFLLPGREIQNHKNISKIIGPLFNTDPVKNIDNNNINPHKDSLLSDVDVISQCNDSERIETQKNNFKKTTIDHESPNSFFIKSSLILQFLRAITLWLIQIVLQFYRPLPEKNDTNEARVATRNNDTQITFDTVNWLSIRKTVNWNEKTIDAGKHLYAEPGFVIGSNNTWWVNVPVGKLAKAKINYKPVLLKTGHHVIHGILDLNGHAPRIGVDLKNYYAQGNDRIGQGALIPQETNYIKNETLHIIQVPSGCACFVSINNQLFFLQHRENPYIFDSSKFKQFKLERISNNENIKLEPKDDKKSCIAKYPSMDFIALANTKTIEFCNFGYYLPSPNEVIVAFKGGIPTLLNNDKNPGVPIIVDRTNISHIVRIEKNVSKYLRVPQDNKTEQVRLSGNIPMEIKTDVFYEIHDPIKMSKRFGSFKNFQDNLSNRVLVCMGNKLANEKLESFTNSAAFSEISDKNKQIEGIRSTVGRCVLRVLKEEFQKFGVEITSIGLVVSNFADKQFGQDLENQTKKVQATKRELDRIIVENNIQNTKNKMSLSIAETAAEKKLIDAKATAAAQRIKNAPQIEFMKQEADLLNNSSALFRSKLAQTFVKQPIVISGMTGVTSTILSPEKKYPNLFKMPIENKEKNKLSASVVNTSPILNK